MIDLKKLFLIVLLFFPIALMAVTKAQFSFVSVEKAQQYSRLTQELRCMVCQNESIAASTATFAADLRQQVYVMVKAGKTDAYVKKYMAARYGNFILFKPPMIKETYFLWFSPILFLAIGLFVLLIIAKKYKQKTE
jgi:cytochrome c-type biogenesis protein CcmH